MGDLDSEVPEAKATQEDDRDVTSKVEIADHHGIDDVSGPVMDDGLAVTARNLEMDFIRRMGVYDKVYRSTAAA